MEMDPVSSRQNPILNAIMQSINLSDMTHLMNAMFAIQSQLSDIQENQRAMNRSIYALKKEMRKRFDDSKHSTQYLVVASYQAIISQLEEMNESFSFDQEKFEELMMNLNFDDEDDFGSL